MVLNSSNEQQNEENNWLKLLEGMTKVEQKRASYNILVIGEGKSGRSEFFTLLTGDKEENIPFMRYGILKSEDEDDDELGLVGIWSLDAFTNLESLIEVSISADHLTSGLIMIMINLSKPYNTLQFLEQWLEYITIRIKYISTNTDKLDEIEFPIMIIGNQCEVIESAFENLSNSYSVFLAYIYQLRLLALKYHCSTIFVSSKTGQNIDLLINYIKDLSQNKPFSDKFNTDNLYNLFIPFNQDSQELLTSFKNKIDIDPLKPIHLYFTDTNHKSNLLNHLSYQQIPEDTIKSTIINCITEISNSTNKSTGTHNSQIIHSQIINDKVADLMKLNDPSLDELQQYLDPRLQSN